MPMTHRTLFPLCLSAATLSLTGCMLSPTASPTIQPAAITGTVHGGQQPVTGARIFLFEAATTGYGKVSLGDILPASGTLDSTYNAYYVTTDSTGSFGLTGKYTCTAGAQVYLLATQGNPGLAAGTNNAALAEMASLGACPTGGVLSPTLTIRVSEVTTVAAVYALAGYMTGPNAVSRANTTLAQTGLANAFATSANLASTTSGLASTSLPSNAGSTPGVFYTYESQGTAPTAMMDTMANVLASCINSDGTTSTTTGTTTTLTSCGTLFANATADGTSTGTKPTDTVTALLNIAHHPAANVTTLYNLAASNAPYQPALTSAPNDFTLQVGFRLSCSGCATYPTLNPSFRIAVDAAGNLVIPADDAGGNYITMILSNLGTGQSTAGSYPATAYTTGSTQGYVIDQSGYAWAGGLATSGTVQLDKLLVPGGTDTRYPAPSVNTRAVDAAGNIYATTSTGVNVYNSSGTLLSSPVQGQAWTGAAVDAAANLYTIIGGSNSVYVNNVAYSGGGLSTPAGLALDSSNSVWVVNTGNNSLSKFTNSGSPAVLTAASTTAGYTGGGLNFTYSRNIVPPAPVLDGASNVWVPGLISGVAEFSNAGAALSPSAGFAGSCSYSEGAAIDGSGNVWVTCSNTSFSYGTVMYEMVGAAVPLATPILPGQFGTRP